MNTIVRTTTDKYGSGSVIILAPDESTAYDLAASEIKREWIPEISIPEARDYERDGESIVAEYREELEMLLQLQGREPVEAWNRSPLNDPDAFDTSRRIVYEAAHI